MLIVIPTCSEARKYREHVGNPGIEVPSPTEASSYPTL